MKGFTLIEMIVAIFIFSLSLGAGLFSLSKLRSEKVEQLARAIYQELDYQALRASLEKKERRIIFETHYLIDENQKLLLALPKNVRLEEASFGNLSKDKNVLILRAGGTATPGRVVLRDEKISCSILQSLYGTRRILCK